jgi:hypothetical protein
MLFIWGQAEPSTTVIAASIPVLRVLFRDISRTYYGSSTGANGYLRSDPQSQFPPANNNAITVSETKLGDESSERSILPPPSKAKSAIMRTTQVAVKYDARRSRSQEDDSGVFEMVDRLPIQKA